MQGNVRVVGVPLEVFERFIKKSTPLDLFIPTIEKMPEWSDAERKRGARFIVDYHRFPRWLHWAFLASDAKTKHLAGLTIASLRLLLETRRDMGKTHIRVYFEPKLNILSANKLLAIQID